MARNMGDSKKGDTIMAISQSDSAGGGTIEFDTATNTQADSRGATGRPVAGLIRSCWTVHAGQPDSDGVVGGEVTHHGQHWIGVCCGVRAVVQGSLIVTASWVASEALQLWDYRKCALLKNLAFNVPPNTDRDRTGTYLATVPLLLTLLLSFSASNTVGWAPGRACDL